MTAVYEEAMPGGERTFQNAIKQDDLILVAALLNEGQKPTPHDFADAVEKKSYSILELFLKHDYDINRPIRGDFPPPLAQVYLSYVNYG